MLFAFVQVISWNDFIDTKFDQILNAIDNWILYLGCLNTSCSCRYEFWSQDLQDKLLNSFSTKFV